MKPIRRFFSSWKVLLAAAIVAGLYLRLPVALFGIDPTAGLFDAGYYQWLAYALLATFLSGVVGWLCFQLFFASMDRGTSTDKDEWGGLKYDFSKLTHAQRYFAVQGAFIFCILLFCFWAFVIPK